MIHQMQHVCPERIQHVCLECRGSGEVINEKHKCQQYKGNKVTKEKKVLEVQVEKGMQHGQKIVFEGQADEVPDTVAGDIFVVLQTCNRRSSLSSNGSLMISLQNIH